MMEELNSKFHYLYSSSISDRVQIKIGTLEGKRQKLGYDKLLADPMLKYSGLYQDGCADLMVVCQIFDKDQPLALPVSTSYKAFTTRWNWNEWLSIPVQFSDLPRTAQLIITIYDCFGPNKLGIVGGTAISLFSKHGLFRQGMLDLRIWPNKEGDGNFRTTTPGKAKIHGKYRMQRLSKLAKKHRNGHITKVDWLDRLTFRELEMINEKEKRYSECMYLMIEFPTIYVDNIPHHIVYFEENGEENVSGRSQTDLVSVPDQEILKECVTPEIMSLWEQLNKKIKNNATNKSNSKLKCHLCEGIINNTSAIKCMKCTTYLHSICFERASEIFVAEKYSWQCKNCLFKDIKMLETDLIRKENECLKNQIEILTKLVSEQDYVNCLQKRELKNFENLVESKHHKLARSLRSGHCDKDAKPTATMRNILNTIVSYPPTKILSNEEQDHVWKYRFYLSSQKKALAKFLKCVNWDQHNEVRQALHMMEIWSPMDVEDALELLSSHFVHPSVRRYAISRLQQAPDDDVLLYLLQLVEALKYENFKTIQEGYARVSPGREISVHEEKEAQLEKKDSRESNSTITNEFFLRRSSSCNEADHVSSNISSSTEHLDQRPAGLVDILPQNAITDSGNTDTLRSQMNEEEEVQDLASFLIQRCCKNLLLANYFYWYLLLECEDQETNLKQDASDEAIRDMYLTVLKTFSQTLAKGTESMQRKRRILTKQQKFIDKLVKLIKTVSRESGNRKKKAEKLQQLLADSDAFKFNFSKFEPIPFPLDPEVTINGIIAEKASLFKSALMPSKLHFKTVDDKEYVAIFKHGDDLRQDQLILQMITLMDKLLSKENLDLKLTPYRVLATSTKHGFVQFIDSVTVAEALASEGSIHNYFRKHHPQENGPYGIAPDIMDTYIRSCAGYCVITYLLGVGDRHLDNLLLTQDGKLFHIDFGYILGRDPKPLPPPMKLSKEMVEAMGGVNSDHFQQFRKLCYTAFLHLRRHANLVLNLFLLMVDASVPDIALEPDKTVRKVQDKLRLDLGDEEAVHYIQNLIETSATAVMAAFVEQLHKITQYIRK